MLPIGEFSNICKVSTKTLRYYAEIGLLEPSEVNPENGYRYYAIEQLEKMLFINRLKAYSFSLDEIKTILQAEEIQDDNLYLAFIHKKREIEKQVHSYRQILTQLEDDISAIKQGTVDFENKYLFEPLTIAPREIYVAPDAEAHKVFTVGKTPKGKI